jgi:hypothetical protein
MIGTIAKGGRDKRPPLDDYCGTINHSPTGSIS